VPEATATLPITEIADQIQQAIEDAKDAKFRQSRPTSIWASAVGHPCHRCLYHNIADWDNRLPPRPGLQALFDQGHIEEVASKRDIEEAGFQIVRQEEPLVIHLKGGKHRTISGKMDWFITGGFLGRQQIPCEHKGYSYGNAEKWTDWRQMLEAPQPWIRSVPAQMTCYLFGANEELGLLALRGKESGQINFLPMTLDMGYAESILQKAEAVYDALDAGEPPDRMKYEPRVCGSCDFFHICTPDTEWAGSDIITDERCLAALRRRTELNPTHKQYEDADKEAKAFFATIEAEREWRCGEYIITRKPHGKHWRTDFKELQSHE